ncbi:glycosyltransferase 87 family protein [Adhaeretor mobilis]|nr:glycosyltransferase 87 family protein [Adhaeretor mobilis]
MPERPTPSKGFIGSWGWHLLGLATLLSLVGYWHLLSLSALYVDESNGIEQPTIRLLVLLLGLFVVYWHALWLVLQMRSTRMLAVAIVCTSAMFRFVVVPSTPILEIDYQRYIWDGAVLAEGISPHSYAPGEVLEAIEQADAGMPPEEIWLAELVELSGRSESLKESLETIHYNELTSPYPMISQLVFALAAKITPDEASSYQRVTTMKAVLTCFDLVTLLLVIGLLRSCGQHLGWSLCYGWCPLLLKEIANGGHLDSIAICFSTAAVWALVSRMSYRTEELTAYSRGRPLIAGLLLGLAIGAKIYPIVLFPLFATYWLRRGSTLKVALGSMICGTIALASLGPQIAPWFGPHKQEVQEDGGIESFLARWEMNDLLFMCVRENLLPQDNTPARKKPWFDVIPSSWSRSVLDSYSAAKSKLLKSEIPLLENGKPRYSHISFELTRVIMGLATLVIACTLAWRATHPERSADEVVRAAFLTLTWFWLLFPAQNPWYWCWTLPFLPFVRYRAWHAMAALLLLYYLRFWLETHFPNPGVAGTAYDGKYFFYFIIPWIEFGILLSVLAVSWFFAQSANKRSKLATLKSV